MEDYISYWNPIWEGKNFRRKISRLKIHVRKEKNKIKAMAGKPINSPARYKRIVNDYRATFGHKPMFDSGFNSNEEGID